MIPTEKRTHSGWAAVIRPSHVPDCTAGDLPRIAHAARFEIRERGLDHLAHLVDDAVEIWTPTGSLADVSEFARRICEAEPPSRPYEPSPLSPDVLLSWRAVCDPAQGDRLRDWSGHAALIGKAARRAHAAAFNTVSFVYAQWVWRWSTAHYLLGDYTLEPFGWSRAPEGTRDVTDGCAELAVSETNERLVVEHAGVRATLGTAD